MSHQRHPSSGDAVKEPHSVSLKVLRLSRPSLVAQYPVQPPPSLSSLATDTYRHPPPIPASLAYSPSAINGDGGIRTGESSSSSSSSSSNPDGFILSPIVNLPPSFGSAYVGEVFSCTLCVNHDGEGGEEVGGGKTIRDVRIEAEMKTPSTLAGGGGGGGVTKLVLCPDNGNEKGVDLVLGETLQKIVNFDLKDEGNHVLAVTVSYYEASDFGGRTRTFRKLYQFICKAGLIVRTKSGSLGKRRWVLEAQLENCGEGAVWLERVGMELEGGLGVRDCNWGVIGGGGERPVLHPGEVEQVCFVVEEVGGGEEGEKGGKGKGEVVREVDGRVVFGVLGIGWRSEMGNRGFLSTGKLGTRVVR